jgi:hypothetical protein
LGINRIRVRVRHVGCHDDRHDGAFGGTHDPHVRARGPTGKCKG